MSADMAERRRQAAALVVPYSETHREAHERFAAQMWPQKRRRREEQYIRWKFRAPQSGPVEGLLLAIRDGQVVGQLGVISAEVRINSRTYACQWACDLMVEPLSRRKGIGSLLFSEAMTRQKITLGSNPTPASDITQERLGFRALRGPRTMLLPLNLAHVLDWKTPKRLKKLIPTAAWLARPIVRMRFSSLAKPIRGPAVHTCSWQDVVDRIGHRQAALDVEHAVHIVHDREFLKWRCPGLPGFSSELRAIRTDGGGYAILGDTHPSFSVYDWSAGSHSEFRALFHCVYEMARQAKGMTIEVLAQDEREERWLRDVGFLGMRQPYKITWHAPEPLLSDREKFIYCLYDSDGYL